MTRFGSGGFADPNVAAVFGAYPKALRAKLLALRRLIFATAAATDGVGPLEETLKWGQPSYLTAQSRSGSTIRIDAVTAAPGRYAMYFHCQTKLVETFRAQYPDVLKYEGNRAILFDADDPVSEAAVRHCVALALTYHLRKGRRGWTTAEAPSSRPGRRERQDQTASRSRSRAWPARA